MPGPSGAAETILQEHGAGIKTMVRCLTKLRVEAVDLRNITQISSSSRVDQFRRDI